MANDRLWLVCRACGGAFLLYKHFGGGSGWLAGKSTKGFYVELQAFIEGHLASAFYCSTLASSPGFTTVRESDDVELERDPKGRTCFPSARIFHMATENFCAECGVDLQCSNDVCTAVRSYCSPECREGL